MALKSSKNHFITEDNIFKYMCRKGKVPLDSEILEVKMLINGEQIPIPSNITYEIKYEVHSSRDTRSGT